MEDTNLAKIDTNTQTTWKSDGSSPRSTTSASMYKLDGEDDSTPILLYQVGTGLTTTTQHDLCNRLGNRHDIGRFRLTRKPIPRFSLGMEVKRHDCWFSDEQDEFRDRPNYNKSMASMRLPGNVVLGRLVGAYPELYILSPALGRPSSDLSSGCSSSKLSRESTFGSCDDAVGGADHHDL